MHHICQVQPAWNMRGLVHQLSSITLLHRLLSGASLQLRRSSCRPSVPLCSSTSCRTAFHSLVNSFRLWCTYVYRHAELLLELPVYPLPLAVHRCPQKGEGCGAQALDIFIHSHSRSRKASCSGTIHEVRCVVLYHTSFVSEVSTTYYWVPHLPDVQKG